MENKSKLWAYALIIIFMGFFTAGFTISSYVHYGYHDCHTEQWVLLDQYLASEPDCSNCLHMVLMGQHGNKTVYFMYEHSLTPWPPGTTLNIEVCTAAVHKRIRRVYPASTVPTVPLNLTMNMTGGGLLNVSGG